MRRVFIPFLMFAIFAFPLDAWAQTISVSQLQVEANLEKYAKVSIDNPLKFTISGAVGTYKQTETAIYTVEANCPIMLHFEASPLLYHGPEPITLNVTYWVNEAGEDDLRFQPGSPLSLNGVYAPNQPYSFELFGEVRIDAIAAQPAGKYEGTITVTVQAGVI